MNRVKQYRKKPVVIERKNKETNNDNRKKW